MDGRKRTSKSSTGRAGNRRVAKNKRRVNRLRVAIFLFVLVLISGAVIATVVLLNSSGKTNVDQEDDDTALFGVKSITVEGNTRYTDAQICEKSGIFVGQSIFFVNKQRSAENILKSFPYIDKVSISNPSFRSIKIGINEATPVGITEHKTGWLIIGNNGKGLEQLDPNSNRLPEYRVIKCNQLEKGGVGHITVDERSLGIINSIVAGVKGTNLEGIKSIDIMQYTDISLNWNDAVNIRLGNDIALDSKLAFTSETLSRVIAGNGEDVEGQIDLRMYSESDPRSVFTPQELLVTQTQPQTTVATSATTASNPN
ncbi:MAG: FtsQ-type POTRA domain-containing protein [Oscillospiraceae bacterium]|nr:FtsQ-type POTRA domain-containing protein [Oscillospiraceae bacterium]MDD4546252.1 FtsQ-type POTRA domain-containing protein [Oscillospiraceae bacterium]